MDANPYAYTIEKLTAAVECLATHPGDARKRVAAVYSCIHMLNEDDFPPNLRREWRLAIHQIVRHGPLVDEFGTAYRDAVQNTMLRSRNSSAAKIATRIWCLYWALTNNVQYQ